MPKITRLLIHSLLKISFKKNYDSRINLDLVDRSTCDTVISIMHSVRTWKL